MNVIRENMKEIKASEELKADTLRYLNEQRRAYSIPAVHHFGRYALIMACLLLALGVGGYSAYRRPVSYISIDVNPSIELGINRFKRVVSADAYNKDGEDILKDVVWKNIPYEEAVERLLSSERHSGFLTENSVLVVTVISDDPDTMIEGINAAGTGRKYHAQIYVSDPECLKEAHWHDMSFGKYRAYQELSQYDEEITVEACHEMTIGEIQDRIEGCKHHQQAEDLEIQSPEKNWNGHHGGHRRHHGE